MKSWALVLALLLVGLSTVPGASAAPAPDCDSVFDSCNYDCGLGEPLCGRFYSVLGTGGALCDGVFVQGCPV